ncbi:MAG TPA: TIGR00341 family protein [Cyanobacteria bacterium UBA8803]|nr:TIGR00341 family protein [Cyanobacteria bacterium UBA9273]HBL59742.1 TIGR00341 family protein [Cyanobacteria bacterium UBA8803]
MRQLLVQVPRGCGQQVLDIANACNGANLAQLDATSNDELLDVVIVHVSNGKVEELLEKLEALPNLQVTLFPRGIIALQPPASSAPQQVKDVQARSPIEIFLSGLQSVGSWQGFLGYAAAAGVVVWIGLFTNTSYLLVAAMLIAPFAGPAMNVAIATARGDRKLLGRSLFRYFTALAVTILVAGAISLILQQEVVTSSMNTTSTVSAVAVLLPLVAGAAGALNLVQSERSSLVSGAAVGMLVAASLAPPAGLVGMASAMGRWDMAINGVFVLLLQLVGINLSASLMFRAYGLSARGTRYERGQQWIFPSALAATIVVLLSLLTWQFFTSPELQRSSREQRATAEIQKVVNDSGLAKLVEANVRFPPANIKGQNTLLGTVYVQRQAGVTQPAEEIRSRLTGTIQRQLLEQGFNVTPLIDVSVLEEPQ